MYLAAMLEKLDSTYQPAYIDWFASGRTGDEDWKDAFCLEDYICHVVYSLV